MTSPRAVAGLAWAALALAACDDAAPPEPDAAPPDMGPTEGCGEVVAAEGAFTIRRCADQSRLALTIRRSTEAPAVELIGLGPALHLGDRRITATDWRTIVWRPDAGGARVDFTDADGAPDLALDLRFDGSCLVGAAEATAAGPADVTAVDALALVGADAALVGLGPQTLGPARPEPWAEGAAPHALPRLFVGEAQTVALAALDPRYPLWSEAAAPATLRLSHRRPLELSADATLRLPWALCVAEHPVEALDALAARVTIDRPTWPYAPRIELVRGATEDLAAEAAELGANLGPRGHLRLDDAWAEDRTEWTPSPAVAALPGQAAPATVGVRWPALRLPADSPLLFEHPDWVDADCATCPRLDPRVPAVREHLARIRLALFAVDLAPALADLGDLDPETRRALLTELAVGEAPPVEPPDAAQVWPPVDLGIAAHVGVEADDPLYALAIFGSLAPHAHPTPTAPLDTLGPEHALALALVAGRARFEAPPDPAVRAALAAHWADPSHHAPARPIPGRWWRDGDLSPAPPDWRGPGRLVLFNPSGTARVVDRPVDLAPDLRGAPRLLDPDGAALGEADRVEIAPGGVVIWATVDGDVPGG